MNSKDIERSVVVQECKASDKADQLVCHWCNRHLYPHATFYIGQTIDTVVKTFVICKVCCGNDSDAIKVLTGALVVNELTKEVEL